MGTPLPSAPPAILDALAAGRIPVVAPLAEGPLNVNADDAAAALAVGLGAERILFLTDVPGVLRDELAARRDRAPMRSRPGQFEGGILPKLQRGRDRREARRPGRDRRRRRCSPDARDPLARDAYLCTHGRHVRRRRGLVADRCRRDALPRLRRRDRRRRARPRAPGAARRRAGAARAALARLQPLLDRADGARSPSSSPSASAAPQAFFCNSGAEAIEAAIKYARKATGKPGIVALENSFHGRTLGALSATGQPAKRAAFEPLVPGVTFAQLNDTASLEAAVGPDTGLILIEPVQGEGGVNPATPGFLAAAAELAAEHGALLCFDEVQTGVGRTGTFFAFEQLGVRPASGHAREGARQRPADRRAARRRRRAGRARARRPRLHLRRQPGRRAPPRARSSRPSTTTLLANVRDRNAQLAEALPVRGAGLLLGLEAGPRRRRRAASTPACSSPRPARRRFAFRPRSP